MRDLLKQFYGKRVEFTATVGVKRRGVQTISAKSRRFVVTRCLENIKFNGEIVTDHIWVLNDFLKGNVKGTEIKFTAIVTTYYKKVDGLLTKDYNISGIEGVKPINRGYDYAMCNYRQVHM